MFPLPFDAVIHQNSSWQIVFRARAALGQFTFLNFPCSFNFNHIILCCFMLLVILILKNIFSSNFLYECVVYTYIPVEGKRLGWKPGPLLLEIKVWKLNNFKNIKHKLHWFDYLGVYIKSPVWFVIYSIMKLFFCQTYNIWPFSNEE